MTQKDYVPPRMTTPISCESCIHSRRCFMSGEHCSKQLNIYQERRKLHEKDQINAFVVMNFSDMSDVVYKWRLKDFIASLSSKIYINEATDAVICSLDHPGKGWKQATKINVLRSDSNPATNYVICNRVCQQMQIADLIIVDVTVENTNVFYEFGMAVALDKLILPICYNDSFYRNTLPADNRKIDTQTDGEQPLEKHIDCFPWRRRLFEYFGLRYRSAVSHVQYFPYEIAANISKEDGPPPHENSFDDNKYKCFPYHQELKVAIGKNSFKQDVIGKTIYETLRTSYNSDTDGSCNTLVIYTMDGFMNGDDAGKCIINFYEHMTLQVNKMHCFCGDRVVTLVQENAFNEDDKDSKEPAYLPYKIGDLIHIGMNQATYDAQRNKIITSDFLNPPNTTFDKQEKAEKVIVIKNHIGNKSLMVPLTPPIYVEHVRKGLQRDVLVTDEPKGLSHYFCFFHVMLRTLQYANEIVVDISNNSVEALFWLGMAHGADIDAIAVKYDRPGTNPSRTTDLTAAPKRSIFDVSGLWTAVLKAHDTEGFYRQLALAQTSIEQRFKLMLTNANYYTEAILDKLRESPYNEKAQEEISKLLDEKKAEEDLKLESFYRNRFWARMIRQNRLYLYMPQKPDIEKRHNLHISKWDVDAVAALSHYLTQRKVISESYIKAIEKGNTDISTVNFISIGASCKPCQLQFGEIVSLAEYVNKEGFVGNKRIRILNSASGVEQFVACPASSVRCRAFVRPDDSDEQNLYSMLPNSDSHNREHNCFNCKYNVAQPQDQREKISCILPSKLGNCPFWHKEHNRPRHIQLGQIVLWRERTEQNIIQFQVSVIGASGPATYALSSIFVDDRQKKAIICAEENPQPHLLSHLQKAIRRDLLEKLTEMLKLRGTDSDLIRCIKLYLSTVLYRYFFPFLSYNDENRICNGLTAYLTALKMEKPDQDNPNDATNIVDCLRTLLKSLRCVEAMYAVEVESKSISTDDRLIRTIVPVSEIIDSFPYTSCYYRQDTSTAQ